MESVTFETRTNRMTIITVDKINQVSDTITYYLFIIISLIKPCNNTVVNEFFKCNGFPVGNQVVFSYGTLHG